MGQELRSDGIFNREIAIVNLAQVGNGVRTGGARKIRFSEMLNGKMRIYNKKSHGASVTRIWRENLRQKIDLFDPLRVIIATP